MAKEKKYCYVLTLPLKLEKWQQDRILKSMELVRKCYNAMLGWEKRELHKMEDLPDYRHTVKAISTVKAEIKELTDALSEKGITADQKRSIKEKTAKKKMLLKQYYDIINNIRKEHGFTEFGFVSSVKTFTMAFPENIGSTVAARSISKPMWAAFSKYFFSDGEKLSFKKVGELPSLCTDGQSFIRLVDETGKTVCTAKDSKELYLVFGNVRYKTFKISLELGGLNDYEQMALLGQIKNLRIIARTEKGAPHFYIQMTLEGQPLLKLDKDGNPKHTAGTKQAGLYLTTTTAAIATEDGIKEYDLREGVPDYSERIADINRYLDASRRATNPDNFNPDGTIKKGIYIDGQRTRLKWTFSNGYKKASREKAELMRKERVARELHHRVLANRIVEIAGAGGIIVNEYNFKLAAKRSEEDELTEKGACAKKKRGGANIGNNAPALLLQYIDARLSSLGEPVMTRRKISDVEGWKETRYDTHLWAQYLFELHE